MEDSACLSIYCFAWEFPANDIKLFSVTVYSYVHQTKFLKSPRHVDGLWKWGHTHKVKLQNEVKHV